MVTPGVSWRSNADILPGVAGTLQRAGAHIVRRAAATGLAGLAVSLFVGVMAFAFSTSPAEQPGQEPAALFLSASAKAAEVRTLSAVRPSVVEATSVSVVPVNEQALLASRLDDADLDAEFAPLEAPGGPVVAGAVATPEPRVAAAAFTSTPPLAAGDRIQATISFYYCQRGEQGLHPGDGGKFCGVMRDGDVVYPGAAACDYAYLGQRFRIQGDPLDRVYTCADTGSAVHGLHRDIWFMTSDEGWAWQLDVGQVAVIEVVE